MGKKILLIEADKKSSFELCLALENGGFEITGVAPYIYNAITSIDLHEPDALLIDTCITDQVIEFISTYIRIPVIIISDQYEKEIMKYSDRIRILHIIKKPYNINEIKTHASIAFSRL
jgi:hypothetical protein